MSISNVDFVQYRSLTAHGNSFTLVFMGSVRKCKNSANALSLLEYQR